MKRFAIAAAFAVTAAAPAHAQIVLKVHSFSGPQAPDQALRAVSAEHLERLPPKGPYILMANHQSHADVPILFASLPLIPGFLAKKELARIPFLSMALREGGHVLIDRKNRGSAREALKIAATEIQAGKTIAVFPEGTRGAGDALGEFKKGGFLIAKKAGVPVVPIGILGSRAVWHRDEWLPRGGRVWAKVGEPISPEAIKLLSVDGLCDRVRASILELLGWSETEADPRRESA